MLLRMKDLNDYTLGAKDGDIGTIADLYFDDESWTVRHLVVATGGWLSVQNRVLIPPCAVQHVEPAARRLVTNLTRQQVERSPGLDTARPVSRQYEQTLYGYYGYPYYWGGPYLWGPLIYPTAPPPNTDDAERRAAEQPSEDAHLRSARDVEGHGIQATDGELGHVADFLVDEETWAFRYLIADPRSWWPGHHVLIPTEWITTVRWNDATVEVNVDKEAVRNAPAFDPAHALDREYEIRYHGAFGRPGYWERRPEAWKRHRPAA